MKSLQNVNHYEHVAERNNMSKDLCIRYNVVVKGKRRDCTNYNFIDVLKCIDRECENENAVDQFFSIKRAEKIICGYCKNFFDIKISKREISSICYPQRGKFPVRAGIILMAMYNLLKEDTENNMEAKAYILNYMRTRHRGSQQKVVEFFFDCLPEIISSKIMSAENGLGQEKRLWNYYCYVDGMLTLVFENETWIYHVENEFPADRFEEIEDYYEYEKERAGRVYLLKSNGISLY